MEDISNPEQYSKLKCMKLACQFIKNVNVFIVFFLTILNSDAVFRTFMLYRQLYLVNKGRVKLLTLVFWIRSMF